MSDSSSLSEVEVSPSSDSLDTLIGLSTETGRTTAVTPSSSSEGLAASSDAALASSDSSRPETPRQEGNAQVQNGGPSRVPLTAPSSGDHAELAAAAAASRPAAVQNTERAPTARGKATAPGPAVDLLVILQQMQEQQLQNQLQQQQQQQQYQQHSDERIS